MGLKSSVYPQVSFSTASSILVNTDILTTPLEATKESLGGDAGTWRVWININTAGSADFVFSVKRTNPNDTVTTARLGKLNQDNTFVTRSGAEARYDINVIPGDTIDFQSSVAIDNVPMIRVHQVQIGA